MGRYQVKITPCGQMIAIDEAGRKVGAVCETFCMTFSNYVCEEKDCFLKGCFDKPFIGCWSDIDRYMNEEATQQEMVDFIHASYSDNSHFDKFREELGEARVASILWQRYRTQHKQREFVSEIADVLIMTERMIDILNVHREVENEVFRKLERQVERIKNEQRSRSVE